ncbi:HAD family hydrolase [Flammeovirga kamogawensis]|uniref:HAD-IA family hydrolase n=1 Tax=Flammeovirga kamogawensis TaxID=373891 RepID=A0ABX8H4M8_9BACT|nr:HAD-IA family hydrolase [Flammeovirga kamogawensis]MBB6460321.1 HAD superfamily hydrolase (TIGR01509 family) [Flammeovirga kamogawensis]QWG10130.1 HAD-IA family hydrolase [Flammeovirga kamogawensis]TRX65639.1 HAD-IA family hydrolase [Flammeovirga kamogawensis]
MKYKCIVFDCDGILVDSETLTMEVFSDLFLEYGWKVSADEALKLFKGKAFFEIMDYVKTVAKITLPEDFEKVFRQHTFEAFTKNLKAIPGIKAVLDKLVQNNIPFCVASNGPMTKMLHNLKATQLLPYFEGKMYSAFDIKKWKPSPDLFLHAVAEMGFNTMDCVVIEDSRSGITAAQNGNLDVIGYHKDANHFKDLPIQSITNMAELITLFSLD